LKRYPMKKRTCMPDSIAGSDNSGPSRTQNNLSYVAQLL